MDNLRLYGTQPYTVALLHGGPGAAGEMAPVAKELAKKGLGVLEPLQTKTSIQGQLDELRSILEANAELPVVLVGYSWGAMLGYIFSATYPQLVKKLILVSSGVFEDQYAKLIMPKRLSHLNSDEAEKLQQLFSSFEKLSKDEQKVAFNEIGRLTNKSDSYDPVEEEEDQEKVKGNPEIYEKVWGEVQKIRKSGEFLAYGKSIACPVVAIHGDYDPHPIEGIRDPLERTLKNFRFILLEKCGHVPWIEKQAKENFYQILKEEIRN